MHVIGKNEITLDAEADASNNTLNIFVRVNETVYNKTGDNKTFTGPGSIYTGLMLYFGNATKMALRFPYALLCIITRVWQNNEDSYK